MAKRNEIELPGKPWSDDDVHIKIEDQRARGRAATLILTLAAVLLLGAMAYGFWTTNDSIIERLLGLGAYIAVGILGWITGRNTFNENDTKASDPGSDARRI